MESEIPDKLNDYFEGTNGTNVGNNVFVVQETFWKLVKPFAGVISSLLAC